MRPENFVVIMAGGIGSRFWPFSRKSHPKQFQDILGTGKTLIQQTAARFNSICPNENIYVVTNEAYKGLVEEQLPFLESHQILLEPVMRNTAPCVAYACYKIASRNPGANIVVAPADHIIMEPAVFAEKVAIVLEQTLQQDILVTLGIKPSRADIGYGYIQVLPELLGPLNKVKTFTEKPNLELATLFLESGDFVWNAGIFLFNVKAMIKAFEKLLPEVAFPFAEISDTYFADGEHDAVRAAYYQCKNISIDYGIMEKADNVYVLPSSFGWSDLGTWKSFFETVGPNDKHGNVLQGNVMAYETVNSIVKAAGDKLVVVQGLDNFIVAAHGNVVLICQKDQEQRIKQFLDDVKVTKGSQYM